MKTTVPIDGHRRVKPSVYFSDFEQTGDDEDEPSHGPLQ